MAYQRFVWGPVDAQLKEEFAVLSAKFGEGYEQRSFNGMRNSHPSWDIAIPKLEPIFAPDIRSFLADHGGVTPFWWRSPQGIDVLVVAPGYQIKPIPGEPFLSLTTQFNEVIG